MATPEKQYPDFLGLDLEPVPPEKATYHLIPVPYEAGVSYGTGTAAGPAAILQASLQLELLVGADIPAEAGIYTHPPIDCTGETTTVLAGIQRAVAAVLATGKVPVILGGEHTVTLGALQALRETGQTFGVVQFDAHADLRHTFENNPYSHACVMRRAHEIGFRILQIGGRSLSQEEMLFRQQTDIRHLDMADIISGNLPEKLVPDDFPEQIYLTFDVDCLDPAIVPATGTPEPGGLFWYQAIDLIKKVVAGRRVVGFDVVELAPVAGLHAPDFTVAKLVYCLMGIINRPAACL